ncbi:MAG: hypothetical protein AAF609_16055 [Cyanobacteria bacterium P01_C01_bin.120]
MAINRAWMRLPTRRSILLGCFLCLMSWLVTPAAIAFPQTMFIGQARHQPNGAALNVTGRVIVPSGVFSSANLDQGFAIQDVTGGIYVTTQETVNLHLGDTVQVVGQLQDDGHGQQMLQLQHWQLSHRPFPSIAPQVTSAQTAGKSLDGKLVIVQGEIVKPLQDDVPYGDRLWLQDDTGEIQIYIAKSTHIAPEELSFLQIGRTVEVTGLSSQFDEHDEVMPRSRADIRGF